ncbi:unnamed protein product [Allacma fusca]|uniref:L-serine deaminase n=1 Tax=Allacma fusca TaxID=39272 RepID=A0A8J2JRM0_9HEXA|nr:unnamed protein product [Allacma fusca]
MESPELYIKTPLLHSQVLSDLVSTPVYLKLENVQLSNSFKIRGFAHSILERLKEGECEGFVTLSAGNGGIGLAYACQLLKRPCHVFVPNFVSPRILGKIKSLGAIIHACGGGKDYVEKAIDFAAQNPQWVFIHPHENPNMWDGYSKMIQEIKEELPPGTVPSCIVASVGGGGLLTGILNEINRNGWGSVPVVATETFGAHCFNKSLEAGEIILNEPMTSVAKTLGAACCTAKVLELAKVFNVISTVITDDKAVEACVKFADDHTFLVEPAAGVSLATVYSQLLPEILSERGFNISDGPVVIIVCGGCDINLEILWDHATKFKLIEH